MSYIPNPLIIPVGIAVGILVSAPVGPVNVLCIQRALQRGTAGGVAAGLGAVLGDGLIAFAVAMGIGAIDSVVTYYRSAIQLLGGIALLVFGGILWKSRVQMGSADQSGGDASLLNYLGDTPKAFLLTIMNPGAVLGLIAIFGGIGAFVEVRGSIDAIMLVGAIMAGSMLWWLMLSAIVAKIGGHLGDVNMGRVNLIAGLALIAFGLVLLSEVAWQLGGGAFMLDIARIFGLA